MSQLIAASPIVVATRLAARVPEAIMAELHSQATHVVDEVADRTRCADYAFQPISGLSTN